MKELWLNFKDEKGEDKRVLAEGEKFAIGRTPDNNLQIPLANLSRQHAKIERFADVFIISDCGSSNGSTLNGEALTEPVALKNGDKLNLGDTIEIEIEISSEEDKNASNSGGVSPAPAFDDDIDEPPSVSESSSGSAKEKSASASSGSSSGTLWLLMLAPVFLVLVLLGLGGAILIAKSKKEPEIGKNDPLYNQNDDPKDNNSDDNSEKETPTPTATPTPIINSGDTKPISNSGGTATPNPSPTNSGSSPGNNEEIVKPPTKDSNESDKLKYAAASFLRRIAKNDSRAFLLEKQVAVVSYQVNQFKGSSALAENIKNAKKNASQIVELAGSKDLKPQFLVVAALTKLGNQRGDVLATAKEIADGLSTITKTFGNDFADDSLLIATAYNSGISGEKLQSDAGSFISKDNPNDARTIRSIWFFRENGKLSNSEFDYGVRFLAIGAITQNPKDFNVSAEELKL